MVGYDGESTNYRVYDPMTKKIRVSHDVIFNENFNTITISENDPNDVAKLTQCKNENQDEPAQENDEIVEEAIQEDEEQPEFEENEPAVVNDEQVRRRLRNRDLLRRPSRYELNVAEFRTPRSYKQVMASQDSQKWCKAINCKLKAHEKNNTWTIIEKKSDMKIIDTKSVFRLIRGANGKVCRHKARLCARRFMQEQGIDNNGTCAPVVRYDTIRVLLAMAAQHELEMIQFDVETAFLHADLKEEVYFEIPEGLLIEKRSENKSNKLVCVLNKPLYGLKQAPRCWNSKFSMFFQKFNFKETNGNLVYLALFVDHGLIMSKSQELLNDVLKYLQTAFVITIGGASMFVGLQIERNRREMRG